jgi:hypothetical protein
MTEVHKIPARVQCTVQVCELAMSNLHPPPYRSRQIICLSQLRVRSPSPPIADAALPSPATCRAVPSLARVHDTAAHIIAHCALCTACAPLSYETRGPLFNGQQVFAVTRVLDESETRVKVDSVKVKVKCNCLLSVVSITYCH